MLNLVTSAWHAMSSNAALASQRHAVQLRSDVLGSIASAANHLFHDLREKCDGADVGGAVSSLHLETRSEPTSHHRERNERPRSNLWTDAWAAR